MAQFFRKILARLQRAQMLRARIEIRRVLLNMSDRQLADIGISRELLERGLHAWPWQAGEPAEVPRIAAGEAERVRAIRELRAYSDRELDDLGLTREGIVDAVDNGRPGIDRRAA